MANFGSLIWRLTVKIILFWRLTANFLAIWRLTVNPIETLFSERMPSWTRKVNVSAMIEGSYLSTSVPWSLAIVVSIMLSMFILEGTFANALLCNRLRGRHGLRKVPHYLLASLSLTGLLTSLLGMPSFLIAIYNCQLPSGWPFTSPWDAVQSWISSFYRLHSAKRVESNSYDNTSPRLRCSPI